MLVGVVGQCMNIILAFVGRLVFIHYLSSAYLGVNGLFSDVLGMLNLAELGIGSAMVFSMYLPDATDDHKDLTRLMNLYRVLYRAVAIFVMVVGLCLMPFLPPDVKSWTTFFTNKFEKAHKNKPHKAFNRFCEPIEPCGAYLLLYSTCLILPTTACPLLLS